LRTAASLLNPSFPPPYFFCCALDFFLCSPLAVLIFPRPSRSLMFFLRHFSLTFFSLTGSNQHSNDQYQPPLGLQKQLLSPFFGISRPLTTFFYRRRTLSLRPFFFLPHSSPMTNGHPLDFLFNSDISLSVPQLCPGTIHLMRTPRANLFFPPLLSPLEGGRLPLAANSLKLPTTACFSTLVPATFDLDPLSC